MVARCGVLYTGCGLSSSTGLRAVAMGSVNVNEEEFG